MPKMKRANRVKSPKKAASNGWKEHVDRLHAIEKKLPEHLKTGLDARSIKTEAKAKHYIKKAKAVLRKVTVVEVPKPAAGSINKDRPMPVLLSTQVQHFYELEKKLPANQQTGIPVETIKTEGQASDYIKAMSSRLHTQVTKRRK